MNTTAKRQLAAFIELVVREELQATLQKRKPIVVANWKMNMSLEKAVTFFNRLELEETDSRIVVCPPYPLLYPLNIMRKELDAKIQLGAQNVHWENQGAYTGEVSAAMLQEAGCHYVLIGHSERRIAGESDEIIHNKVKQALQHGLQPIICVGESSAEYNRGLTNQVITSQVEAALSGITDISSILIAYEPVWAIGTGQSARPDQAEAVHRKIRHRLMELYGDMANVIPILYGGSVNTDNASKLAANENINGVLVGGASLEADSFRSIIGSFSKEMEIA